MPPTCESRSLCYQVTMHVLCEYTCSGQSSAASYAGDARTFGAVAAHERRHMEHFTNLAGLHVRKYGYL